MNEVAGAGLDGIDMLPVARDSRSPHNSTNGDDQDGPRISPAIGRRLYLSHFLSTWNSRSFEFGAVLFLAVIFPGTLLYMSIYALVRDASAIIFATAIGSAIDNRGRLSVLRFSIIAQRIAVIFSCVAFWSLWTWPSISSSAKSTIFSILILLSCLEKTASILNLVAVERDWVVVIAGDDESGLQVLNARMRRIDLICKLGGPLFIALIQGASTKIAILTILGINTLSVVIEYFTIARVYNMIPALQNLPNRPAETREPANFRSWQSFSSAIRAFYTSFKVYFNHPAFIPSFALSVLYFTVLSLGGQMVTYLLLVGYNSFYIGLVRTLSVIFELSATWIAPKLMARISPTRAGIWFLGWQMITLGASLSFFWSEPSPLVAASGLVAGTILSRIGLWGYDLSAQIIIQLEVEADLRGSFSTTEASFQNAFEMLSYVSTIIFSHPSQFRYPVLLSVIAVYFAGFLYATFVKKRRGHLLHLPTCIKGGEHETNDVNVQST